MANKNSVVRVGVIGPGGAGRGNTLAFATRNDVEIVAAADNNEQSLDALERGLQEQVEGYTILEKEGYNRQSVLNLIDECVSRRMY